MHPKEKDSILTVLVSFSQLGVNITGQSKVRDLGLVIYSMIKRETDDEDRKSDCSLFEVTDGFLLSNRARHTTIKKESWSIVISVG